MATLYESHVLDDKYIGQIALFEPISVRRMNPTAMKFWYNHHFHCRSASANGHL